MRIADEHAINFYLKYLCQQIGPRYSGSIGEKKAADFIENQFRKFGLDTHREKFKFLNWKYSICEAIAFSKNKSYKLHPIPVVYSTSTPSHGIYAPLIYLERGEKEDIKEIDLKGKVGLILGDLHDKGSPDKLIRLNNSGLVAILLINPQFPFSWPVSLGMPPEWAKYVEIPILCLPYFEGDFLIKRRIENVKIKVKARRYVSSSFNIIGEIKGESKEAIVICSHHDTVLLGTGANDNGSGTAFVLELARLFSREKPYRSIRFITFGAEEKRSAGADNYIRHKKNIEDVILVINADCVGSVVGINLIYITGSASLRKFVKKISKENNFSAVIPKGVSPWFSDHFSFNLVGIPSIWINRPNTSTGFWNIHSKHDNLENISSSVIAKVVDLGYKIVKEVSFSKKLPFSRGIPGTQKKEIKRIAKKLQIPEI